MRTSEYGSGDTVGEIRATTASGSAPLAKFSKLDRAKQSVRSKTSEFASLSDEVPPSEGRHTGRVGSTRGAQMANLWRKEAVIKNLRRAASQGGSTHDLSDLCPSPAEHQPSHRMSQINEGGLPGLGTLTWRTGYPFEGDSLPSNRLSRWTPTRDGWDQVEYKGLLGLRHIFVCSRDSIYVAVMPRILVSLVIVTFLKLMPKTDEGGVAYFQDVIEHQFTYQIFTYVLGFVLVFRINLSYMRWWDARTAIEAMSSHWFHAALLACTFDEYSTVAESERVAFRVQLSGLVSLMHAEAVRELGGRAVPYLEEHLTADDYADRFRGPGLKNGAMQAQLWITMLLTGRFNRHVVQSPICARMYEALSEGMLSYHQAVCIRTTPFPFSFVQIIQIGMFVFVLTLPLVMVQWVEGLGWALFFTAFTCFGYTALMEAANELEQPFGEDENDHPILAYQIDFDKELRSLSMGGVSYAPPRPCSDFLRRITGTISEGARDLELLHEEQSRGAHGE